MSGSIGKVFWSCVEPDAAHRETQHLWIDTNDGNTPKRWNGWAWVVATDKAATDAVADAKATISRLGNKADAHAVSELTSRIARLDDAVTSTDGYVTGEKPALQAAEEARRRANADDQLAKRIDGIEASADAPTLAVDPGQAIEPLRMGGVTFYGESARVIRDAQAVLQAAGAGQLEVVKRANESGEPFVVIEGQVFISEAVVGKAKVSAFAGDYSQSSVKLALDGEGRYYVEGVGLGVDHLVTPELRLGAGLEEDVRRLLRAEMKPGGILNPV
ncbi:hypothetical protein ACI2KC_21090 [Pseudomonas monteilii]